MRSRAPLKVKPDAKISEDDLEQIAVSWPFTHQLVNRAGLSTNR